MASFRQLTSRLNSIQPSFRRTMATAKPSYHFLVILPDKPDALQRRLNARGAHFEGIKPQVNARDVLMGGALLKDVPKDDNVSSLDFLGSTLIMKAESKEKAIETLKKDPYSKADVWDWEKVQIYPFKLAFDITGKM